MCGFSYFFLSRLLNDYSWPYRYRFQSAALFDWLEFLMDNITTWVGQHFKISRRRRNGRRNFKVKMMISSRIPIAFEGVKTVIITLCISVWRSACHIRINSMHWAVIVSCPTTVNQRWDCWDVIRLDGPPFVSSWRWYFVVLAISGTIKEIAGNSIEQLAAFIFQVSC